MRAIIIAALILAASACRGGTFAYTNSAPWVRLAYLAEQNGRERDADYEMPPGGTVKGFAPWVTAAAMDGVDMAAAQAAWGRNDPRTRDATCSNSLRQVKLDLRAVVDAAQDIKTTDVPAIRTNGLDAATLKAVKDLQDIVRHLASNQVDGAKATLDLRGVVADLARANDEAETNGVTP